jgi:hypothetical protein
VGVVDLPKILSTLASDWKLFQNLAMTGYTKLFGSIVASTIWREAKETKIVWITMLALADQYGIVSASIPGLADLSKVTIEECEASLAKLMSPDPYSRSKENEGRRIEEVDGGWRILNYVKYRQLWSDEDRKNYKAKWDRENRPKRDYSKYRNGKGTDVRTDSNRQKPTEPMYTDTKADTDTKAKEEKRGSTLSVPTNGHVDVSGTRNGKVRNSRKQFVRPTEDEVLNYGSEIELPEIECRKFCAHHETRGWTLKDNRQMVDWKAALRTWKFHWLTYKGEGRKPYSPNL